MQETPDPRGVARGHVLLGRYETLERIGGGGFSSVYRGWDLLRRRPVAVKICCAESGSALQRFAREARLAAALHHRNIVRVYESDPEGAPPFLVEEYLNGEDLSGAIRRGEPASVLEKVGVLDQVAAALAYAHRQGVVHRDVKPENIRLLEGGAVKIMDFGIAKDLRDESEITRPGMAIGSAGHMSPEQIEGGVIDHRTDLFSWGVVAYELVSGREPFAAPSLPEIFERILKEDPEPLVDDGAPAELDGLIRRALAKRPAFRPQSADEIRVGLQCVRATLRPPAGHRSAGPAPERLSRLPAAGAAG